MCPIQKTLGLQFSASPNKASFQPGSRKAGCKSSSQERPPQASAHKAKVCLSPSTLSDLEPEPSPPGCCQSSLFLPKSLGWGGRGVRFLSAEGLLGSYVYAPTPSLRKASALLAITVTSGFSLGPFFLTSWHSCKHQRSFPAVSSPLPRCH